MARVSTVRSRGLKARDAEVRLGQCNLLLGQVGAGKSSVLDSIRYGFLGFVPHLGRSEAATARLMRNGEITVDLILDDGRFCRRTLAIESTRKGTTLRGGASCSWLPEDTISSEAADAIVRLAGQNAVDAAEHLDLRELLACTPAERARRITALLDASGMSPEAAEKRGRLLFRARLREANPAQALDLAECEYGDVAPPVRAVAPDVLAEMARWLSEAGIGKAEEVARETRLAGQRQGRDLIAARRVIEDELATLRVPAESAADLKAKRQAAVEARARAIRDIEAAVEATKTRTASEAALPALRLDVVNAQAVLDGALAALPRAAQARQEASAIEDPADVIPAASIEPDAGALAQAEQVEADSRAILDPPEIPAPATVKAAEDVVARAGELEADARKADAAAMEIRIPEEISTLEAEVLAGVARQHLQEAQGSPWREVERIAGRIQVLRTPGGPLATHLAPLLENAELQDAEAVADLQALCDALRALAAKHGGDLVAIEKALADAKAALAARQADAIARDAEITLAKGRIAELQECARGLRKEAQEIRAAAHKAADEVNASTRLLYDAARRDRETDVRVNAAVRAESTAHAKALRDAAMRAASDANAANRQAYADACGIRAGQVEENRQRREALSQEARRIALAASEAQVALDRVQASLREMESRLAGIASVAVDVPAAEAARTEAEAAIATIDPALQAVETADVKRQEMARLVREIAAADALGRAWAAAEWACGTLRQEDLWARSSGLLARMGEFLTAAGRTETPFIRTGKAETTFGWVRDGHEIAVEALSGGEAVIYCTALAAAVISLRSPEVRLLLIEAAELGSAEPVQAVLRGCRAIAEAHGLQVLVATNAAIPAPEGWTVHEFAMEVAHA